MAFEAAYGWAGWWSCWKELGLEPHLVHPSRCKATASARRKNDKVDARTLAQLLGADLLPEVWIAPPEIGDLRALLGHQASLVRLATGLKNRAHEVLADGGIWPPSSLWATPGRAWRGSKRWSCRQPHARSSRTAGECWTPWPGRSPGWRRDRRAGQARPQVQARMALPGVGMLTAMTLAAEIGDLGRFPTAGKLCAWAGLTPGAQLRPHGPPSATSPSRLAVGVLDPAGGRPDGQAEPTVGRYLRPAGPPPWPSPAACWPVPSTS